MIERKKRVYHIFFEKIKSAQKIALVSHINPDVDTLGSSTALYQVISEQFPYKEVSLICASPIPEKYHFVPNSKKFQKDFYPQDFDLIIFFDSGGKSQTGFDQMYPKLYDKTTFNTVSIDHHITNEKYAKQNILNITYASTTMILCEILVLEGIFISQNTATSLLAGIYTDTGGLKHSNTSSLAYKMSSYLIALGAQIDTIVKNFFMKNSLSQIRLWGRIMKESFVDKDQILHSYVNQSLLSSYDCTYDDIGGVIDILNTTQGIKYSTLLTQKGDYIKGSLRTLRDDIDLTLIAKQFSGGGHKKASGFTTLGTIETFQILQLKT